MIWKSDALGCIRVASKEIALDVIQRALRNPSSEHFGQLYRELRTPPFHDAPVEVAYSSTNGRISIPPRFREFHDGLARQRIVMVCGLGETIGIFSPDANPREIHEVYTGAITAWLAIR